jgi:outer membrane protein OmpA-like peptidoglycan-associated protein
MKTLGMVLIAALFAGCGSKPAPKAPEVAPQPVVEKPAPVQEAAPPAPVSPSLAVSAGLAALCSIKSQDSVPPTFDYDKAELAAEDREVLQQVATCLTVGPAKGKSLSLVGRADPRGTEEYNMGLGAKRAQVVSVYLQRLGVPPAQLKENTRGAIDATGTDEASWRRDRRVDLDII